MTNPAAPPPDCLDPEAWYDYARTLYDAEYDAGACQYDMALAGFDRALELDPNHVRAWLERGVCLFDLQRFEDAIESFDRALALNPSEFTAWLNRGVCLYLLDYCEAALDSYSHAIELDPTCATGWFNQGVVLAQLGRSEEAIASYSSAIELDPAYANALLNRGALFETLERYAEALADYDELLEFEPENAEIWHSRAGLLNNLGRFDEGEASFARSQIINARLYPSLAMPSRKLPVVDEPAVVDGHTDFAKAFQDGYTFARALPNFGLSEITFSTYEIGELHLPSGQIVACDPSVVDSLACRFDKTVAPGRYPVLLSVIYESSSGYSRVACALIRFGDTPAVRWELAQIYHPNQKRPLEVYGVDQGTGCFMAAETATRLLELAPTAEQSAEIQAAQRVGDYDRAAELMRQSRARFEQEFLEPLWAELQRNAMGSPGKEWANLPVGSDPARAANVIAFESGYGDGAYASYWGYDAAGDLVSLVTDFEAGMLTTA